MMKKKSKATARPTAETNPDLRKKLESLRDRPRFYCGGESAALTNQAIEALDRGDAAEAARLALDSFAIDTDREKAEITNEFSGRLAAATRPAAIPEKPPSKKPVKPIKTEYLTKTKLAEYFGCDRSEVKERVIDVYPHETTGKGNGERYRLHVADMPPGYQQKHLKQK